MAINSLADLRAARRETLLIAGTPVNATTGRWRQYAYAAAGDTTSGIVPTDANFSAPTISFPSGRGHVSACSFSANSAGRVVLADRLFAAGAINAAGTTTLSSQPSFSSRIPGGTDYSGLQIWADQNGVPGGAVTVSCTYTNESGTTGQATSTVSMTANQQYCSPLALADGDKGVQKIETVVVTMGNANSGVNVHIVRPLWSARYDAFGVPLDHGFDATGLPEVWADSCLMWFFYPDVATSDTYRLEVEIASK